MIKRLIVAVLFITTVSQSIKAQIDNTASLLTDIETITSDSLTIQRASGQKIVVVWPYRKNIQKAVAWEELLDNFQADFKKVSKEIPDYDYYHINYIQKKELVVNQVVGKQTFTVNENDGIDYVKSNLCLLKSENLGISIEFTDHEELLDASLKQDIANAIAQVKNRFYISSISPERHLFDAKNNEMLPRQRRKYKLFVPLGVQLGVLRNKPYLEMRPGIGVTVDNRAYIALHYSFMSQFNDQRRTTEFDHYIGMSSGTLPHGFGSEVGVLVKSGISNNKDLALRAGINYRTRGGILMSAQYYIDTSVERVNGTIDFGFSIGYGF